MLFSVHLHLTSTYIGLVIGSHSLQPRGSSEHNKLTAMGPKVAFSLPAESSKMDSVVFTVAGFRWGHDTGSRYVRILKHGGSPSTYMVSYVNYILGKLENSFKDEGVMRFRNPPPKEIKLKVGWYLKG